MNKSLEFDAFISHASEDKATARLLRGYLRSHNIEAWFDSAELKAAVNLDEDPLWAEFKAAIEKSRYFIFLISSYSLSDTKKWPRRELEYARQQRDAGKIEIVGIIIDKTSPDDFPEWAKGIKCHPISFGDIDTLEHIREDIGREKATYISKVEPNFIKQIPFERLTSNLRKGENFDLSFWYINGGHSIDSTILPYIEASATNNSSQQVKCRFLFFDHGHHPDKDMNDGMDIDPVPEYVEELFRASNLFIRRGRHEKMLEETIQSIKELNNEVENVHCDVRVCNQIPAGRIIFSSGTGFFMPFISKMDFDHPIFVFDQKSPFYVYAEKHFEQAFSNAGIVDLS